MYAKLSFLVLIGCCFMHCNKAPFTYDKVAVFDDLCDGFERYCGTFESRQVNWDSLREVYRPEVVNSMSEEAFFDLLKDLLMHFRDPHIWLIAPQEQFYTLEHLGFQRNINLELLQQQYLSVVEWHSNQVMSGSLTDSIGYLYISDFKGTEEQYLRSYEEVYTKLKNQKGLIIDMRANDGGIVYNAQNLLAYLADTTYLWHQTQNRTQQGGFDQSYNWHIYPREDRQWNIPVVVLTGRYTVSAGERFVLGAMLMPQVTILGDTTATTQGSVMGREMLNGWTYTLTFEKCIAANGQNYEGVGIPPDIVLQVDSSILLWNDPLIDKALELLR